jgi:hypothetical protein
MYLRDLIYKPVVWLILAATALNGSAALAQTKSPSDSNPPEASLTAPANDNFANAQLLTGATGSATGANNGATKEAGEPAHARNRGGASVWYKYIAPGNGTVTFDATSSSFDTLMAVYKGTNLADLKRIAANDDTFSGLRSVVTVGTQINDVFYIAVDGFYYPTSATFSTGTVGLNYGFANSVGNDNFANAQPLNFVAGKMITTANVGASRESGEPTSGNQGGKSVWYKWVAPSGINTSYTFTVESTNLPATSGVKTIAGIYSGTALNNLNLIVDTYATNHLELSFGPTPGQTYYFTLDGFDSGTGAEMGTFTIDYGITRDRKTADFDDDGLADLTVFRPSTGNWYTLDSVTGQLRSTQFGTNGDHPLLADLGTDGKLDYLVFRPDIGAWYVNDSEVGFRSFQWGLSGDVPLIRSSPAASSFGIFRDIGGLFGEYSLNGSSNFVYSWGKTGDIPIYTYFNFYGNDGPTRLSTLDGDLVYPVE